MTDFWENVNEGIEDNAGLLGAAGGLAALKGQQAQREKLSAIEAQLQKAENRVEKEAQLKRKLIALEEIIDEALESESKLPYFLQFKKGFTEILGKPSESLTSLDDIKYARDLEKKAAKLDEFFPKYSKFLNGTEEICKSVQEQLHLRYSIDRVINFDSHDAFLDDYRSFMRNEFDRLEPELKHLEEEHGVTFSKEDEVALFQVIKGIPSEVMGFMKFFLGGMHQSSYSDLPIKISFKCKLSNASSNKNILTNSQYFSRSSQFQSELSAHLNKMTFTSFDSLKESLDKSTYFSRCFSSNQFFYRINRIKEGSTRGQDQTSGCFIATAVYGDYNHPQVLKLRHYRDSTLKRSFLGCCFISFYYAVGPYLAVLPDRSVRLRRVLRSLFDCL